MLRLVKVWDDLRSSLWLIPTMMSIIAAALTRAAGELDYLLATSDSDWIRIILYHGDLEGSRKLLSTVAGSMITVAGVTFSVTVVALSLASSQFGPRLLLRFMRDRGNQVVLGTFIATFLYCLIALGNGSENEPPTASASIGLLLAIASVAVFIYFIHHVSTSIRAEHVVDDVARGVERAVASLLQEDEEIENEGEPDSEIDDSTGAFVTAPNTGYIQALNVSSMVKTASETDVVCRMLLRPGHFVVNGEPLAIILPSTSLTADLANRIQQDVIIGRHRTDYQDPEFGIHQLVEVAVRALSPGINDPHTAILCINWLHAALHRVARGHVRPSVHYDKEGSLRLVTDPVTFEGLISSAFDQIRQCSYSMPAVSIHLMDAFASIASALDDPAQATILRRKADALLAGSIAAGNQSIDREDIEARHQTVVRAVGV